MNDHTIESMLVDQARDVFTPKYMLRARHVSGNSRKWREYQIATCTSTKDAVRRAVDLIDSFSTVVRVEIYADGRYIKEVPSDGADPDNR
jgi:hypothetical protein